MARLSSPLQATPLGRGEARRGAAGPAGGVQAGPAGQEQSGGNFSLIVFRKCEEVVYLFRINLIVLIRDQQAGVHRSPPEPRRPLQHARKASNKGTPLRPAPLHPDFKAQTKRGQGEDPFYL